MEGRLQDLSFTLESFYRPAAGDAPTCYRLVLHNDSAEPVADFRLGFSGPARIAPGAAIENGRIVAQLSNWCEIAPPDGFVLQPGESWTIEATRLDYPLKHWTDGAQAGMIFLAHGAVLPVRALPTRLAADDTPTRRGRYFPEARGPAGPEACILPYANGVEITRFGAAPAGLSPRTEDAGARAALEHFAGLTDRLFAGERFFAPEEENSLPVVMSRRSGMGGEAYKLSFSAAGARLEADSETGFLYGLISLGQMLHGARLRPKHFSFPVEGTIDDAPQMGWRGCHLDVARRFYPRAEIIRFLDILAWNKLNRFHWHLSDDEAWRVEIAALPALSAIAAFRGPGLKVPPLLGSGVGAEGGFYTQADIRAIVSHAGAIGIEVVPEIDVPGHCHAMLEALPHLKDPQESGAYYSIQAFPNNCLNPAVPEVYTALETIIGEMAGLFPSRYFHLGADEVPEDAWQGSPLAQAMMAAQGFSRAAELQALFLQRLQKVLTRHGKTAGAWEEAAEGGGIGREASYLVGWRTAAASRKLAAEGYDVVAAPAQAYYLDMALGPQWAEPGASWAGFSSAEASYAFDPLAGWTAGERRHFLGVQGCIWSEPMLEGAVFDRLVFPRLSAIAETGWTGATAKSWSRFAHAAPLGPSLYGF